MTSQQSLVDSRCLEPFGRVCEGDFEWYLCLVQQKRIHSHCAGIGTDHLGRRERGELLSGGRGEGGRETHLISIVLKGKEKVGPKRHFVSMRKEWTFF